MTILKSTLITILCIFVSYNCLAQGCFPNDLTLRTQTDVQDFASQFPICTIIEGNLRITNSLSGNDEITDLGPLSNLTAVNEDLDISGVPMLTSLQGLQNIESVGEDVIIDGASLTDISALGKITSIGRNLTIANIANVDNAFSSLTTIGDNITIRNSDVAEISGFNNLSYIPGDLLLSELTALRSMDMAFNSLDSIGEDLDFRELAWEQISGFSQLVRVGLFRVYRNPEIKDLSGLNALREIHELINVGENDQLVSLAGLENIDVQYLRGANIGVALSVYENPLLELCNQDFVCEIFRKANSSASFRDNAPACSDIEHLYFTVCRAHVCYSNELEFMTQADVDNFFFDNPKCTYIEGDLIIGSEGGSVNSSITNLEGLEQIDTIIGSTIIANNRNLTSIEGIARVDVMTGDFRVVNNENLEEIDIPSRIRSFQGDIDISDNFNFTSLEGPLNFVNVNGSIVIRNNASLQTLDEFEELIQIGGDYIVENNGNLTNTGTFDELAFIGGDLIYRNNESMMFSSTMRELTVVGGDWVMEDNPKLVRMPSIWVDTLVGSLVVKNNESLNQFSVPSIEFLGENLVLDGLPELTTFSIQTVEYIGGDMVIRGVGKLVDFDFVTFRWYDELNGDLIIEDNPLLESLDGLQWLSADKVNSVEINNNPLLGICNIGLICAKLLYEPNAINISGNTGICTDNTSLKEVCDTGICYEKGADLYDQNQVDAFVAAAQACHILDGNLEARSSSGQDIDITELGFLEEVHGEVSLSSHTEGDNLKLGGGLRNLRYIEEDFFYDVDNEIDFSTFYSLEEVGGRFQMWSDSLLSFKGLERLKKVGSLILFSSESVRNMEGLEGLKVIEDVLQISFSDSLSSLNGLENLEYVGDRIQISGEELLTDIYAINHVDPRDLNDLSIMSRVLTDCNLKLICEFMFLNPEYEFLFHQINQSNCSDFSEVGCEDYGISGYTFFDADANGIKDPGELGVPNIAIQMILANRNMITNERGRYISYMEEGQTYEFEVDPGSDWTVSTSPTTSGTFMIQDSNVFDIGLVPNFERHTSTVSVSSDNIRCFESGRFFLRLQNTGTFSESGEIHFKYDPSMTYITSDRVPSVHDEQTSTLIWDYTNFTPYESMEIELEFTMPNQSFAGDVLINELTQYYDDDQQSLVLGNYTNEDVVRCAYDPNDKQIDPPGKEEEKYVLRDESVVYTLRFQNTGNDFARNIRLTDTLSQVFDISSFKILNSSHNLYTSIEDRVINFYFDDIYLIDSLTNPIESQGQVSFRINFNRDTPDSTIVENNADIYFDFNEPIRTNTVSNTVVEDFGTSTVDQEYKKSISIFPNPTDGILQIELKSKGLLQIFEASSKVIYEQQVMELDLVHTVDLSDQNSGIFILQFIGEDGVQYVTKVFKE